MYNDDFNNNSNLTNNENKFNVNEEQTNINDNEEQYQASTSFDYPNYMGSDDGGEENKGKKTITTIVTIIILLIIISMLGFFGYTYFSSNKNKGNIDSITVEGGTLNQEFSLSNSEYSIESINDSVKLICTYKGKKINIEGCNKSIVLNDKSTTDVSIKINGKNYNFSIVKVNSDSPVITEVTGNDAIDWVKSTTLSVEATFKNKPNSEAYSFDGGKTWQKDNKKQFKQNGDVSIVVRDESNNLSAIYTEKIEMIDSVAPTLEVAVSNKLATITAKDNDSGITNLMVTENDSEPKDFASVALTKETIMKYNAITDGNFYVWAKDKAGNVGKKKFTIGNPTNINNNNANNNGNSNISNNNNGNNNVIEEVITISNVSGNTSSWTSNVTLKVNASTNKSNSKLVYSFDGGKTYQESNTKNFTSNQEVKIYVKNSITGKTASVVEKITHIDTTAPNCSSIEGASTTWTKDDRNITVICSDNGSGCKYAKTTKTFNTTTKSSNITIYDNAGNKAECSVNVYVDKTGPELTYNMMLDNTPKKFHLFVTDNESGINLDTVKYKEKILKNGVDNIWHKNFNNSKELNSLDGIYYQYRFTKEISIYKYFTITASDNLGNISEIQISVD